MDPTLRKRQEEFARSFNLKLEEYLQLARSCTTPELITILELMKSRRVKSAYRKMSQLQVRRWLENNLMGKPLTEQQFKALQPKYSIVWELPR